jgi:hypothetical protein
MGQELASLQRLRRAMRIIFRGHNGHHQVSDAECGWLSELSNGRGSRGLLASALRNELPTADIRQDACLQVLPSDAALDRSRKSIPLPLLLVNAENLG